MELQPFLRKPVIVLCNDGRIIVGIMTGFDQNTNVVLAKAHERIYSTERGVAVRQLGLHLLRVVGEIDEALEQQIDYEQVRVSAIGPIVH